MIPELRKRHRRVWQLWALLLPAGFFLAIWVLPEGVIQPDLIKKTLPPLPNVDQVKETTWLTATIRSDESQHKQLEIYIDQPLSMPSGQLYWQNAFLGSLDAKGVQRFPLDSAQAANPPFTLEIRDPILKNVFQTIIFEP